MAEDGGTEKRRRRKGGEGERVGEGFIGKKYRAVKEECTRRRRSSRRDVQEGARHIKKGIEGRRKQ